MFGPYTVLFSCIDADLVDVANDWKSLGTTKQRNALGVSMNLCADDVDDD